MSEEDRLILLSIAAEEVGYTPERLRQLIKANKVQAEYRGRLILLRESEIQRIKDTMPGGYKRRRGRSTGQPAPLVYPMAGEHATGRLRAAE